MPIKTRGGHLPSLEREVLRNCRRSQLTLPSAWGEEPREYLRDQCKAALAHGSVSACLGLRASSPGTRSIHGGTRAERPADSHRKKLGFDGHTFAVGDRHRSVSEKAGHAMATGAKKLLLTRVSIAPKYAGAMHRF